MVRLIPELIKILCRKNQEVKGWKLHGQPATGESRGYFMKDEDGFELSIPKVGTARLNDAWRLIEERRVVELSGEHDVVHVFTIVEGPLPHSIQYPSLVGQYAVTIPRYGIEVPPNCTCTSYFFSKRDADRRGYRNAQLCKHIVAGYLKVSPHYDWLKAKRRKGDR